AAANTRYWFSVVQVGIPESVYQWDATYAFPGHVFQNQLVGETWTIDSGIGMAFELTSLPEPASATLVALAGCAWLGRPPFRPPRRARLRPAHPAPPRSQPPRPYRPTSPGVSGSSPMKPAVL